MGSLASCLLVLAIFTTGRAVAAVAAVAVAGTAFACFLCCDHAFFYCIRSGGDFQRFCRCKFGHGSGAVGLVLTWATVVATATATAVAAFAWFTSLAWRFCSRFSAFC